MKSKQCGTKTNIPIMCVSVCMCRLSQEGYKKLLMLMAPLGSKMKGKHPIHSMFFLIFQIVYNVDIYNPFQNGIYISVHKKIRVKFKNKRNRSKFKNY